MIFLNCLIIVNLNLNQVFLINRLSLITASQILISMLGVGEYSEHHFCPVSAKILLQNNQYHQKSINNCFLAVTDAHFSLKIGLSMRFLEDTYALQNRVPRVEVLLPLPDPDSGNDTIPESCFSHK